jgi:hypothetical protein
VKSLEPKLSPTTVIDIPPEDGVFGREEKDATGASNENRPRPVPTAVLTVT